MSTLFDHLLTCPRRSAETDFLIDSLLQKWTNINSEHLPPVFTGASPTIAMIHVAALMQADENLRNFLLKPPQVRQLQALISEARSNLIIACRANKNIANIRQSCTNSPTTAEPDGIFEDEGEWERDEEEQ
jgi:hypothetical protein